MNVGIFTDCYLPQINGVITSIVTLKEELEAKGHQVTIITTTTGEKIKTDTEGIIRLPSVTFLPCKTFRVASLYNRKAYNQIKKLDLDILHTHTEFSVGLFGRYCAKRLKVPHLHTYHTLYENYVHYISPELTAPLAKKLVGHYTKFFTKNTKAIIAPTSKTSGILMNYGVKTSPSIIPTGVTFNAKKSTSTKGLRLKYGLQDNETIFLSLGRVAKEKNIDFLICTLPQIPKDYAYRLLIVGDGPYRKDLMELAKELNVEDRIVFVGAVPYTEVGTYYQLADFFINCSLSETQGLTTFEAMNMSLPVIARNDECLEDVLIHEQNGLKFATREELLEILEGVFNTQYNLEKMVENAHYTCDLFSALHFGEKVESLYETIR